jgi:UDP-N-acetylmuramoyl-tripeptide--D-alanyl-D-alanine ligase
MSWTVSEILSATGGVIAGPGVPTDVACSVSTDTRCLEPGALFVALHGERRDGHSFVVEAARKGATSFLVDHVPEGAETLPLVRVADTLKGLGDLAAWTRNREPLSVVAVTGSNGKTTTKEMIAAICVAAGFPEPRAGVLKTQGNLNNLIGLPLTLLRLRGDEAVAVLEMGMNRPGEIARLTEIARPDYGVVVNVGMAHIEGLGSMAGVAAAKGELFAGMSPGGTIAVNVEDEWVCRIAAPFPGRKIHFGCGAEVEARDVVDLGVDGVAFRLCVGRRTARVRLPLPGRHNVTNALAAAAIAHAMGMDLDVVAGGLGSTLAVPMRMQVCRLANGVTVVNDAYNANPSSVEAALETLSRVPGRLVVVLGDMRELGGESRRAHLEVGERAASLGVHRLVLLGDCAEALAAGARRAGMTPEALSLCSSHAEAADAVAADWRSGDTVLVKGSRGMKLEQVVRLLEEAGAAG